MSKPFSFQLFKTDGAARRGEIIDVAWKGADAGLHAGRDAGDRERSDAGRRPRDRRRDRPRQHLSSDAAPRRRAHRGAWRPAQVHELAAADPDRFRRLPGDVVVRVAQDRRTRGDVPLASRRRHGRAFARARDRDSGTARCRHFDAARRVPEAAGVVGGNRARDAAVVALGRALETRLRGACEARLCPVRHRAGRRRSRAARRERARADRHGLPGLCDRRTRGRRAAGGDAQDRGRDGAGAAGGPPALSDGRRHAARSHRSREARHRHVRLRDADPQRPPRHGLHALRPDQSRQCAPRERSAAARRGERASGRAYLFARLSASPDQGQRDARRGAALDHQSCLLPGADGRHARGDRRRALCRISGRPPEAELGARAICQPL